MKSKIFSSVLCSAILASILSLSASEQQETQIYLSEIELQEIFSNPKRSYIYVGKEVSDIQQVIAEISKLDENKDSAVWGLANHMEKGFAIGNYDAVAQALEQAEAVLRNNIDSLDSDQARYLSESLNNIIDQIVEDRLSLDAELLSFLKDKVDATENMTRCGLRLLVINEKMHVHGKAKFYKDVTFTHDVRIEDDLRVDGSFSVGDQVINCDLTVGCNLNLSDSADGTIGNITKNGVPFISNFGADNTFVGGNAGNFTMAGINNVGIGTNALNASTLSSDNVAIGFNALASTTDIENVAIGSGALQNFVTSGGGQNVAVGFQALFSSTAAAGNTAVGYRALHDDVTTDTPFGDNSAFGWGTLSANTTGVENTALGNQVLEANNTGSFNTAAGSLALQNSTGDNNIALGYNAGNALTTGSDNIYIGADAVNPAESNVTRIGGIRGATTGVADALTVMIDSTGQLGTINSSHRVKHNIHDMGVDSANIYRLRPVTFAYNNDATETKQYGLIAEEVDAALPQIVIYDAEGLPQTVQYHALTPMMLNELQKLAARVAALESRS